MTLNTSYMLRSLFKSKSNGSASEAIPQVTIVDDDRYYVRVEKRTRDIPVVLEDLLSSVKERSHIKHPWPGRAGPALQVISIAVFKPDQADADIYGEISARDYLNKKYYFYQCPKDDLELLQPGWNNIFLTCCPIAPIMAGNVNFKLTNDNDGVCIFDKEYDLNNAAFQRDGTLVLEADGNCGYKFRMLFTKIPFATIARLSFILVSPPPPYPDEDVVLQLYGKITANDIVCMQWESGRPAEAKYGSAIRLVVLRDAFAVAVDSSLSGEVELYTGTTLIFKGPYSFDACDGAIVMEPRTLDFDCVAHGYSFYMEAQWMIHEDFFDYDVQLMDSSDLILPKRREPLAPGALVEVFSVHFGSGSSTAPPDIDLFGTVIVLDGREKFNIFDSNKDGPDKMPLSSKHNKHEFRTLSLKWPDDRWVVGEKFHMYLKLKDSENHILFIADNTWWNDKDSQYDSRLCDVYRGDKGYIAAIHYSVFKNGKKAKVSMECSSGTYSIYGSVFAKYKDYDYSSTYDEQCYRSILFKRSEEDAMDVMGQIHLLKSQVSAPSDCNELIVCGDLWMRPSSETCPYKLFHIDTTDGKSCNIGWGGSLNVKVAWV